MKKNLFSLALIVGLTTITNAQVGINTDTPSSTLDVSVKGTGATFDNSQTYGLQAPRLTRAELTNISATYGQNQRGALIYVTDITGGNVTGQRVNVTAIGYYYFDGTVWKALKETEPWRVADSSTEATKNDQNIYQNARVGIGNFLESSPETAFHILGTGGANDNLTFESRSDDTNLDAVMIFKKKKTDGTVPAVPTSGSHTLGTINYRFGTSANNHVRISAAVDAANGTETQPSSLRFYTSATDTESSERMRITGGGRVGIGTTSPNHALEVNGIIKGRSLTNGNVVMSGNDLGLYNQLNQHIRLVSTAGSNAAIALYTDGSADNSYYGSDLTLVARSNRVGIGIANSTTPGNKLEVKHGTDGNSGLRLTDLKSASFLSTNANGDVISTTLPPSTNSWYKAVTSTVTEGTRSDSGTGNIYQEGNIGIRTPDPKRAIHITGDGNASDDILIDAHSNNAVSASQLNFRRSRVAEGKPSTVNNLDRIADIIFSAHGGSNYQDAASIRGVVNGTVSGNSTPIDLLFLTGSSEGVERLRIKSDGNVGIGTAQPGAKLHVRATNGYEAIQIQDGSQGEGKFLASDANGRGTWITSPLTAIVQGEAVTTSTVGADDNFDVTPQMYLYKKITLTKGKWMVNVGQLFNAVGASETNNQWVRLTLSSSETSYTISGFNFLGSRLVSGWLSTVGTSTEQYTFLTGVIPVEVTANNVTLYLRTREAVTKGTVDFLKSRISFQENYLFAIPAY